MDRQATSARTIDRTLMLEFLAVAGITLLIAAPLRCSMLDTVPPGLSLDEAAEGMDAIAMLHDGRWPVFLTSNNGREPLFAYVVAAMFAVMGPGVAALRLAAAVLGVLAVPATYVCVRELFDRRTAILVASMLTVSGWHIHLSRLAVRPVALPLFAALTMFFLWRALRTGRAWAWVGCGLSLGLSFYTYMPVRLLPAILAQAVVTWLLAPGWCARARCETAGSPFKTAAVVVVGATLVAMVVAMPLGIYFWRHPSEFMGRAEQVSIANAIRAGADVGQTIASSALKTAGMFFVEGDLNPRHNLPGKPIFDVPMAILTILGLGVCLKRIREPACATVLWWNLVMLAPAILSDSAPHFLRSVGLLPGLLILPGLGLSTVWGRVIAIASERFSSPIRKMVLAGLTAGLVAPLALSLAWTVRDVFCLWPTRADTRVAFDVAKVASGDYLAGLPPETLAYVGPLETTDQVMRFLHRGLVVRSFGWTSLPLPPEGRGATYVVVGSDEGVLQELQRWLPSGRVAESVGDAGVPLFTVYQVQANEARPPLRVSSPGKAVLGGQVQWLGYELAADYRVGSPLNVTLVWRCLRRADANYEVFVHLVGPDGQVWAIKNAQPGEANQPTSTWAPGETVIDRWSMEIPPWAIPGEYHLRLGLVNPVTGQRLSVTDEQGRPLGTELTTDKFLVSDALVAPPALISARTSLNEEFASQGRPQVRLRGITVDNDEVMVGNSVVVTLFWQALNELEGDVDVRLALVNSGGQVVAEWGGKPVGGLYPVASWKAGRVVRDRWALAVPATTAPGVYRLEVGLAGGSAGGTWTVVRDGKATLDIGRVIVKDRERQMTPPMVGHSVGLRLGDSIRLLGYDVSSTTVRPGDAIKLRLYWECLGPVTESYTVFTHLLDAGEKIWAQDDSVPGRGTLPTSGWVMGEFVEDEYSLVVAPEAPTGEHVIEVGMYLAESGQRLPIIGDDGRRVGDRVLLANIRVEAR